MWWSDRGDKNGLLALYALFAISGTYLRYILDLIRNGCHHLMQKATDFNDTAIVSVKRSYYRIHFLYKSKDKPINLFKDVDIAEESGILYKIKNG